jgi:large subunit ribosomal protein L19
MNNLASVVSDLSASLPERPDMQSGDKVRVHVRITEGDKSRVQLFEGIVIALHNKGLSSSFTVRKVSYGVGVERVFPLYATTVEKIEVLGSHKVRRSRLYYLRDLKGKAARLKERR